MIRKLIAVLLLNAVSLPAGARAKEPLESAEFDCDALQIETPLDHATLHDLAPAHPLDEAAAILGRHGVRYQRGPRVLTLTSAPARVVREISRTKQGEPIILPNEQGSAICVLTPSPDSI